MATAIAPTLRLTTEELLSMPEAGMDRWLINGELREKPMSVRNRFHSRTMARITKALDNWLDAFPEPRGYIVCGDAGFRLRRDPDTTVGIDVAFVSAEVAACQDDESTIINGVPVLAVEILSPSDVIEGVEEKVDVYLASGVAQVWIVDTHDRTVTVYRPTAEPVLFSASQQLSAEPELPGFRAAVVDLFR